MKRLGVIANCNKDTARATLRRLATTARALDLELVADPATHALLPEAEQTEATTLSKEVESIMALGGDGTVLGVSKLMRAHHVPLIGVNLGSLGFMTSVAVDHLEEALECLAEDRYAISTRTTLTCTVFRGENTCEQAPALNDVVLGWGDSSRVVCLQLSVNDEPVTQYVCDGLIISTPTGSTGHSLSAGGPILHPETNAFIVNAICPHTLSARPMVLPDDRKLTIEIDSMPDDKNLLLSVDGQQMEPFRTGDRVTVQRHPEGIQFIHLERYSYFDVLRQKLHWRGTSVPS